jgi:uncharacterized HAD superfamily protein
MSEVKCQRCHEVVNPVVVLDIDGTLGDYHEHFRNFLMDYYDIHDRVFSIADYLGYKTYREFFSHAGVTDEMYREGKLAYRQGGWKRTMTPYADFGLDPSSVSLKAPAFPTASLPAGTELWIATSRPYQRLDNIDPDTREWLRRHNIQYTGLLYGQDKYQMMVDRVGKDRIAFVLEDLPEQYDAAEELGLPVWQIRRTHNTVIGASRPRRVYAGQVTVTIQEAVRQWRRNQTA